MPVSFPITLGTIVHYREPEETGGELRAGIVARLPAGGREAWIKQGEAVDLSLFTTDQEMNTARLGVPLDENLAPGTWCPQDVGTSRFVEEDR